MVRNLFQASNFQLYLWVLFKMTGSILTTVALKTPESNSSAQSTSGICRSWAIFWKGQAKPANYW